MQLSEAKARVLDLIAKDIRSSGAMIGVSPDSPDPKDPAKFLLQGKPARVFLRFSGWHPYVSPEWFGGGSSAPRIKSGEFYWYVFHIPPYSPFRSEHYFICDAGQMREWVTEFLVTRPGSHVDHPDWRAAFDRLEGTDEHRAYFRWGDEPRHGVPFPTRVVLLDNVSVLAERTDHVGPFGVGGESEAHRLLKLYVAERPQLLGLSPGAVPSVEHPFMTGDRVDVLFGNHGPKRSVVEVEVEGEREVLVGIHQAIKYRALAAAQDGFQLTDPQVRAYVVAYQTTYPATTTLAKDYDVRLVTVDREKVLRCVA